MNKRTIFLALGILVLGFLGYVGYVMLTTKSHSPTEVVTYDKDGLEISVTYSRPYKKGRLIFGPESEGALQPFGQYWRLGANEATEITFNRKVEFGSHPLDPGRYVMYGIPGESSWVIGLNTDLGRWGYAEVDHDKDVLQIMVAPGELDAQLEQFTIDFTDLDSTLILMGLKWDRTFVPVPIRVVE